MSIKLKYVLPISANVQALEAARAMADRAYGDEFQREWVLHDLLCGQVVYDLEAEGCHSAWGALVGGRAVCDGYAKAMTLLARLSYIECGVALGQGYDAQDYHAWNLLKVDGSWTWLDPTNNDQAEGISYFYFNVTDEWLARSYDLQADIPLPACTDESVSWHARTWRLVGSTEEMEVHIFNNFRNLVSDGVMFNLRFREYSDYIALRDHVTEWAERYNQALEPDVTGQLIAYCNDGQRCVIVQVAQ